MAEDRVGGNGGWDKGVGLKVRSYGGEALVEGIVDGLVKGLCGRAVVEGLWGRVRRMVWWRGDGDEAMIKGTVR